MSDTRLKPRSVKLTPVQVIAIDSPRYAGLFSIITRWFWDRLINNELPPEFKAELEEYLRINKIA